MDTKIVLLSTRKGLVTYQKNEDKWGDARCHFKAIPVTFTYVDPRHGTWWACLDHGHWGVKMSRSDDQGDTWVDMTPPQYPEGCIVKDQVPAKNEYMWSMTHGGVDHPDRLWLGTIPGGLFMSEDRGKTWSLNKSLWEHPSRTEHWFGAGFDHPGIHSIIVDPRDSNHLTVGISVAGVFESFDAGESWDVRNVGLDADFLPDPKAEVGHDPHIMVSTIGHPDILWQQNHCGIFKSLDGGAQWVDVTDQSGPAKFGFAIAVDAHDPQQAWVAPAISDEVRVAIDGALCICRTDDGGLNWQELRNGLPQQNCYDIVFRHALANREEQLAFGTTTGNLFYSDDRGDQWHTLSTTLPMIYSVAFL